ncbi:MAG: tetratricopeptide repeat protein [Thermodesulfobacteriota bacterium]|nr:tetratricopeptide repeat protein [Thermodesulfobacteriota bacterium]
MKLKEMHPLSVLTSLTLSILLVFFFSAQCFGQPDQNTESYPGPIEKTRAAQGKDEEALNRLKKMTPEEIEALDKKLAQALTLFYDRKYARALPFFREISEKLETMDIMFWSAMCAQRGGAPGSAIKKFNEMLDIDPNLYRVRLELATAYFNLGKYDLARQQLEVVRDAKPPESVKENIEKLIAAIDEKTRKFFPSVHFSLGIQHDSNVSTGPDRETVGVPGGGALTLTDTQKEVSDWVTVTNLSGDLLCDPGSRKGLMWDTTASFYQTNCSEHYKFDFTHLRCTSGPWWVWTSSVLKLPVAYARNSYEHDELFDTFDVSPSYEYFFTRNLSMRGMFSYSHDSYEPSDSHGENNINRIWEINPNFYFNNRNDIVSIYLTGENRNAKDDRYSYDGINVAVSYFRRFSHDTELFARYKYSDRDYKAPELLWTNDREEERNNLYIALSQEFLKHYFASIFFNWIDNDSNTALYDYDKIIYGLNVGFKF